MTGFLDRSHIKALAKEDSVRGVLVRMTLEQAEQADHQERVLLEEALQLLLERFQNKGDDIP
jgi:hypothetical protein